VQRVTSAASELDRWVPAYQFSEVHTIEVHAPPERVYRAMLEVTPEEVAFYRALTWVRRTTRVSFATWPSSTARPR